MIFWNILLLVFLILLNGALAMAEIAVISSRQIRLQQRVEDGDKLAETALELMRSPSHFLSTVQIGITLIGILAGAVGGGTTGNATGGVDWADILVLPLSAGISAYTGGSGDYLSLAGAGGTLAQTRRTT